MFQYLQHTDKTIRRKKPQSVHGYNITALLISSEN